MAYKIELYTKYDRSTGYHVTYERHPDPGGEDMPILSRDTEQSSREDAQRYIDKRGSCFKFERLPWIRKC